MNRKAGNIDVKNLEKWLIEAHKLGTREIGLASGTEPLASKYLEHFIKFSKKVGYEYTYYRRSWWNRVRIGSRLDGYIQSPFGLLQQ